MRAFNQNGSDDYQHADERQARCSREFVDIAMKGERIRHTNSAECYDELSVGEYGRDGYLVKCWE